MHVSGLIVWAQLNTHRLKRSEIIVPTVASAKVLGGGVPRSNPACIRYFFDEDYPKDIQSKIASKRMSQP